MRNEISKELLQSRLKPRTEDVRGPYFRDQTAIIHCAAFRRLKHKTQVFFAPENDHICTRIEHVLHVATIAETICKGLNNSDTSWQLDAEIAYAAGLGHDLGHTPFGHSGEKGINEVVDYKFMHEINSLRVVDKLANNGRGLNLTYAIRDGILCHCGEKFEQYLKPDFEYCDLSQKKTAKRTPSTWEGCAVRIADKIAYLGRDIEDALIAKVITRNDIPDDINKQLGDTNGKMISVMVIDVIENTNAHGMMGFSDEIYKLYKSLSKFNYEKIYNSERKQDDEEYCVEIVKKLHSHLMENYDKIVGSINNKRVLDKSFSRYVTSMKEVYENENASKGQIVVDYVAGMTDNYALASFKEITLPAPVRFL